LEDSSCKVNFRIRRINTQRFAESEDQPDLHNTKIKRSQSIQNKNKKTSLLDGTIELGAE